MCGMDEREKFLGSLCASEFDPDDDDDNPLVRNIPSPEDCNVSGIQYRVFERDLEMAEFQFSVYVFLQKDVCNTFCNEYGPGEGVRRMQCVYGGQFCQCEGDYRIEVVVSNAPPLGASIMLLGLGLALFLTVFSVL